MCGIAGILDNNSRTSPERLTKGFQMMLDGLKHRGPDDRGEVKIKGKNGLNLNLGHQRLSIIDTSQGGHQPMTNNDSTIWISTNSEIYNYKELKHELKKNYKFRSNSDTEVILRSYETWGIDCIKKLRGMFALAIWDGPNNKLFLARDRIGIKPLYYYSKNNIFMFSSELRAMIASKVDKPSINPTGIFEYLAFGRVGSHESILDSIKEIPPGHFLIADDKEIKINKYWDPFQETKILESPTQIVQRIGNCLNEVAQQHLVSDVSIGAFLSGGIDSSAVVSMISTNTPTPIKTIAVTFKDKVFDESKYSSLVANHFGTQHQEFLLSETDLIENLIPAIGSMDQPTVDGINTYMISQAAKSMGLKVALSGLGGDELFAGYNSFSIVPRLNKLKKILNIFPIDLRKKFIQLAINVMSSSDKLTKLNHLIQGQYNGSHVYFLFRSLFCEQELGSLFSDPLLLKNEISKNLQRTQELIDSQSQLSTVDTISYLEMSHYMNTTLLRDTDTMSMAHGLEVRVPLLDHKLIELMFSIPSNMKIKKGSPKPLLTNSLTNKLPKFIVQRKKMGFTLPFEHWMRGKMRSEIETVLLSPSDKLSNFISQDGVQKTWSNFLDKRCSWSRPWSLYVLKKWADKNL
jgi:asparagine synthase (glutamine-hydrolysing)